MSDLPPPPTQKQDSRINKTLIVVIIFLALCVVGLVGFVIGGRSTQSAAVASTVVPTATSPLTSLAEADYSEPTIEEESSNSEVDEETFDSTTTAVTTPPALSSFRCFWIELTSRSWACQVSVELEKRISAEKGIFTVDGSKIEHIDHFTFLNGSPLDGPVRSIGGGQQGGATIIYGYNLPDREGVYSVAVDVTLRSGVVISDVTPIVELSD